MAKKKNLASSTFNQSGWYPETNFMDYSYVTKFQEDKPELYASVYDLLDSAKSRTIGQFLPSLDRLQALYQNERTKEQNLVNFIMRGQADFKSPQSTAELIRTINTIFALEPVFERNLQKILAIEQGSKEGKIDISSHFTNYLESELKKSLKKWEQDGIDFVGEADLKMVFRNAMIAMFKASDNGNQAYLALAQSLEQMDAATADAELDSIFNLYFGKSIKEITQEFRKAGQGVDPNLKGVKITYGKGFQGNVMEVAERIALQTLTKDLKGIDGFQIVGTGETQMKADNIITIGFELTKEQEELLSGMGDLSKSLRAQNIQRMESFMNNLRQSRSSGYVVEISDKSYNLTSEFFARNKGFTGQSNVKLTNLVETLGHIQYQQDRIDDIIFVLANSGDGMINGKSVEEVLHYLATLIGYFLFDDIDVQNFVPTEPAAVHLLNLDGIYIPLSVFLQAAHDAFRKSVLDSERFVHVSFHEAKKDTRYNQDNVLTQQDWIDFRAARMDQTYLSFHFFGDFVNFIAEHLKV